MARPQGKHSKSTRIQTPSERHPNDARGFKRQQDGEQAAPAADESALQADNNPALQASDDFALQAGDKTAGRTSDEIQPQQARTPKDPTAMFKAVDTLTPGTGSAQAATSIDEVPIQTPTQVAGSDGQQISERPFARGSQRVQAEGKSSDGALLGDKKKNKSKHSRLKRGILIALGIIVLAVAGLFAAYVINTQQHDRAKEQFNQGINLMQEVDETVIALDTAVNEQVTIEKLDSLQELIDSAPAASAKLDEANAVFDGITKELANKEGVNLIDEARTGVAARKEMLDLGAKLVSYDIAAMKSANALTEAWTAIVDADTRLRTALALMTSANTENATTARNESTAAIADLDKAISKLDEAAAALPGTDFNAIKEYAMVKREAITYAIASDEAYLAGNSEETKAQTDNYNQTDTRVVELASALPEDPTTSILTVYESLTDTMRKQYLDARSRAASADATVRDYLGINETMANDTSFDQIAGTT